MDVTRRTSALAALAFGVSALVATSPAVAAPDDTFVVDTQFHRGPSSLIGATGVFSGCTWAWNLFATAADDGQVVRFLGGKRLSCEDGATVLLDYDVVFDPDTGATAGTWRVTSSTLDGVGAGDGGGLMGDPNGCTVQRHGDGCMLDTFTLAG